MILKVESTNITVFYEASKITLSKNIPTSDIHDWDLDDEYGSGEDNDLWTIVEIESLGEPTTTTIAISVNASFAIIANGNLL